MTLTRRWWIQRQRLGISVISAYHQRY